MNKGRRCSRLILIHTLFVVYKKYFYLDRMNSKLVKYFCGKWFNGSHLKT